MLVLSRKSQQSIKIGDVVITVIATSNGRAKIGVTAPESVRVQRVETIGAKAFTPKQVGQPG
jgi:carbon storage regulator